MKARGKAQAKPEVEGSAGREHPAELRGQDADGNVRPADNRYLTSEEIAKRDAYVAEETGEHAQQLLVKAEDPDHVGALNSRDREN